MRTYWSAIFSSVLRVRRALFARSAGIVRSRTKGGFTSKIPAGRDREPTREYLSQLSDALAAFQWMSDRRRLGIKNEAEGYGLIPLTQGKFAIVDALMRGMRDEELGIRGEGDFEGIRSMMIRQLSFSANLPALTFLIDRYVL